MIKSKIFKKNNSNYKELKSLFFVSIILFLSTAIALLLWGNIFLPLNEINNFGSEYFTKSYNKHNDTIRFIFFILLSTVPFLFVYI